MAEPKGFPKVDLEIGVRVEVVGFVVAPATFLNRSGVSTAETSAEEPPKSLAGCEGAAEKEENIPDFGGAASLELENRVSLSFAGIALIHKAIMLYFQP